VRLRELAGVLDARRAARGALLGLLPAAAQRAAQRRLDVAPQRLTAGGVQTFAIASSSVSRSRTRWMVPSSSSTIADAVIGLMDSVCSAAGSSGWWGMLARSVSSAATASRTLRGSGRCSTVSRSAASSSNAASNCAA
jgi:hypothetical protein